MIRRKAGELIPWLARVSRPKATDGPVSGHQGRASNLYVIRLDDAVLQKRKFRERNPHYRLRGTSINIRIGRYTKLSDGWGRGDKRA